MYTLGTASKATGKSKSTLSNAIAKGLISASRDAYGQYAIDPAELHRVYPLVSGKNDGGPAQNAELVNENERLKIQLEAARELNNQIREERDNLRVLHDRLTSALPAPQPPSEPQNDRLAEALAHIGDHLAALRGAGETFQAPGRSLVPISPETVSTGKKTGFWAALFGRGNAAA